MVNMTRRDVEEPLLPQGTPRGSKSFSRSLLSHLGLLPSPSRKFDMCINALREGVKEARRDMDKLKVLHRRIVSGEIINRHYVSSHMQGLQGRISNAKQGTTVNDS